MSFEETVKEYVIAILAGRVVLKDISETAANLTALLKKRAIEKYRDLIEKLMEEFSPEEVSSIPDFIAREAFEKAYDMCDDSFSISIEALLESFSKMKSTFGISEKEFYETFIEFVSINMEGIKSNFFSASSLEKTLTLCYEYEKMSALLEHLKEKLK